MIILCSNERAGDVAACDQEGTCPEHAAVACRGNTFFSGSCLVQRRLHDREALQKVRKQD